MDINRLIELVKERPGLYDEQSAEYQNYEKRLNLWKKVSKAIGEPVEKCKQQWRTLRSSYTAYLRQVKKNGKGNYKYADKLRFLDRYLRSNRRSTSLSSTRMMDDKEEDEEEEELDEETVEEYDEDEEEEEFEKKKNVGKAKIKDSPNKTTTNITSTASSYLKNFSPSTINFPYIRSSAANFDWPSFLKDRSITSTTQQQQSHPFQDTGRSSWERTSSVYRRDGSGHLGEFSDDLEEYEEEDEEYEEKKYASSHHGTSIFSSLMPPLNLDDLKILFLMGATILGSFAVCIYWPR